MAEKNDPFQAARQEQGTLPVDCDGEPVSLVLRLKDVRKTAKDWRTFSSDNPLMCVLHSEEHVRGVRQLPLELDPPDHTDYRAVVADFFRRPTEPDYMEKMDALVREVVSDAVDRGELEAVRGFALPLQSRALTHLLNMPAAEADVWTSWGVHVFHDRDDDAGDGRQLEAYTAAQFERAEQAPGEDFFSLLNRVEFRGRKLSFEEKQGYANVTFAGGRDTIINTVSSIFAYLGEHPEALDFLRQNEEHTLTATEEFVRYVSPLTAITRTCPQAAELVDTTVPAGGRIGLCWPSANRDESIFDRPNEVVLDRKPNPHIGFGFGTHNCLGAPHARLIIRCLLRALCDQVEQIALLSAVPKMEEESSFTRQVGYESVQVRIVGKQAE